RRFGQPLRGWEAGATGDDVVIGGRPVLHAGAQFEPRETRSVHAGGLLTVRRARRHRAECEGGTGGGGFAGGGFGRGPAGRCGEGENDGESSSSSDADDLHDPLFLRRGSVRPAYSSGCSPALS